MKRETLEALYRTYSRQEYEQQLQQIVADVRSAIGPASVKAQIRCRVKSFAEYHRKWTSLGAPIGDMLGVRIVCPFLDDVLLVERALSESLAIAEIDRKADHHSYREFGYDSTHLVLDLKRDMIPHPLPGVAPVCEIQIRTVLQDAWAEVEHELIYKSRWAIPTDQIRRKLAALNANLTLSDLIFQELRDLQREVQRKQEQRRDIEAAQAQVEPVIESNAIRARLKETIGEHPRMDLEQLLLCALSAHAEGDFATAIHTYSAVLARPDSETIRAVILNHRGMAYVALSENHAARADFETAVTLDRTSPRAWLNLGLVCRILGDLEPAIDALDRAKTLDASLVDAQVAYVHCLLDRNDIAGAKQALTALDTADTGEVAKLRALVESFRVPHHRG